MKSPSEFLPSIRRSLQPGDEEKEESDIALGWKVNVTNRKEREEALRYVVIIVL